MTRKVTVVVVPADLSEPVSTAEAMVHDLLDFQRIVRGSFRQVIVPGQGVFVLLNEDALPLRLQHNVRATRYLFRHGVYPNGEAPVAGVVVFVGEANGEFASCPPLVVSELIS